MTIAEANQAGTDTVRLHDTTELDPPPVKREWAYEEAFARHDGLINAREQEVLRNCRVAIVGMGGVGGIHLVTLGRLGIGKFTIADGDRFELANINRQHGARWESIGRKKADVMADEIRQINPQIKPPVDLRVFPKGLSTFNIDKFLEDADVFVDGIDFFSIGMRRRLFRAAAERGIYAITAAPLGFGTAWLIFDPKGMSFDKYFDLRDSQSDVEQLAAFAAGLCPAFLQRKYFDIDKVDLSCQKGPSTGLACQLAAGVTAAEIVKILLRRGGVRCAPYYFQFDAYRGRLRQGRLWGANRGPLQRIKRHYARQKFAQRTANTSKAHWR